MKVKLCGMSRADDIITVNELRPEYIGFIFWPKSKRYITDETARDLKAMLRTDIKAVGVFVDDDTDHIASLANQGIIDVIQLHGSEDEAYIQKLRVLSDAPIIKAFKMRSPQDAIAANATSADMVLLDNGTGTGETFDWSLIRDINRPYFLAGGLTPDTVHAGLDSLNAEGIMEAFALDVSSGIETSGIKDPDKMRDFVTAVRTYKEKKHD